MTVSDRNKALRVVGPEAGTEFPTTAAPSAEIVPFPATAQVRPTGGFGRLPKRLITGRGLSPEAVFHLGYRSLHAGNGWGCNQVKMAAAVRRGYSLGIFKRTIKELKVAGLYEREQGKRKKPGRGRGYAVDHLTFEAPETSYVMVDRDLYDGSLTPLEIAAFLYLRARGKNFAEPWHLDERLMATRPTINAALKVLADKGLVANYGSPQAPRWGCASLKNTTFKKTTRKRTTFKKTTRTRKTLSSLKISPPHQIVASTKDAERPPFETNGAKGTDCDEQGAFATATSNLISATEAGFALKHGMLPAKRTPMRMDADGTEVRISDKDRKSIEALGGDVDDLFDRTMEQKAKSKKPIGSVVKYMIGIAKNDAATALGTELGVVQEVITGNTHGRKAALAKATSGKPKPSAAVLRDRARTTAPRSDGGALMASLERLQQGRRP